MFFDDKLVKDKVMSDVWRAGHNLLENSEEKLSFPIICEKLNLWVDNETKDPRKRMSLRTSAVLIDGAAKLMKRQLQQLVEDAAELDENMVMRNRINSKPLTEVSSKTSSSSYATPEQMMHRKKYNSDSFESLRANIPTAQTLDKSHLLRISDSDKKRQSSEPIDFKTQTKRRLTKSYHKSDSSYPLSQERTIDSSNQEINSRKCDQETIDNNSDQETNSAKSDQETIDKDSDQETNSAKSDQETIDKDSDQETNSANSDQETVDKNSDRKRDVRSKTDTSDRQSIHNLTKGTDNSESVFQKNMRKSKETLNDQLHRSPTFTDFDIPHPNYSNYAQINRYVITDKSDLDKNKTALQRKAIENETDPKTDGRTDGMMSDGSERSIVLETRKTTKQRRKKKVARSDLVRKDKASQTVSFPPQPDNRDGNSTFSENLPFGYLLVFDSYNSRLPSKIILSSLRPDLNNLVTL